MNYNGNIYRPPIEAHTMLIPITEGCTHNKCTFCNMYQNVPFRMWSLNEVENYAAEVKSRYGRLADSIDRVYLVGADPFALSAEKLLERISLIKKYLPNVAVITMYARTDNIAHKTDEDLKRLKEAGVNDLYIGVECGLNDVLSDLNKGYSADETRAQCLRLNAVGIDHCDLLMLGTAGKGRGLETAKATAALENEIKPAKILLNTMSAFEGTVLDKDIQDGRFTPATEKEILQEEYAFLQTLELPDTYFWAIHPLDSVGVEGVLKTDKDRMLAKLGRAIETVDNSAYNRVSRRGTL
ncbi:MAG: radical SAM protein [Ruminococcus sp.]|nr:radical SAM protein [Ruminococcus sp.]